MGAMDRLDACYFCGTAADAPLRAVTIAPRDRRDDPDAAVRVTLCPSCEDKLERVLVGLFDHVESRRVESSERGETAESADDEAEPPDREVVDRIDVSAESEDADTPREGRRRLFTDASGDEDPDSDTEASDAEAAEPADEDAEILDDEEPRVRARATSNPEEALDGVSVAEYNRVMRLLQNREFPMARAAFVDLADSAYDLGEETVQTVLDAVIDKGGLDESEGQLVRPDEGPP